MFEGKNTITLCDAASCALFSQFLSDKFGLPIEVESIKHSTYDGLSLEFTEKAQAAQDEAVETLKTVRVEKGETKSVTDDTVNAR